MGRIAISMDIRAPIAHCFDLARDVEVHCVTSSFTGERVMPPGRTAGLLELDDTVTFEGRHFGVRLKMTARIVEMKRPFQFVDELIAGPFVWFRHDHQFKVCDGVTQMVDALHWKGPLGPVGRLVDTLVLERHMAWYLRTKQQALKELAEQECR
jgi:ligand-binding SRPBCC domain-containing protein